MALALRPLRQTRGGGLYTVTSTLLLVSFEVGETVVVEIDHSTLRTTENTSFCARFADSPAISTAALGGFRVEPICDGTNGDQFRIKITYIGQEAIIEGYPQGDVYTYPADEETDYFYEGPSSGSGTLTWTRVGVLSDDA